MSDLISFDDVETQSQRLSLLKQRAHNAIINGTAWLDAGAVDRSLSLAVRNQGGSASRWLARRRIFAIHNNERLEFPAYAFAETGRPIPALAVILRILDGYSALRIAAWFESTSARLGGKRPRELLASDARAVIAAARAHDAGPHYG